MSEPLEPIGEPGDESTNGHAYPLTLVDDLRQGERAAFVRFYELYRLAVYRFALRLLSDRDDAQAATRHAFIRAYRQILLHGGAADLTTLVYRAAVDTCRQRAALRADPVVTPATGGPMVGRRGRQEGDDLGGSFEEALQSLDERQRAALLLHDVHGLRADEIATVFGLSAEAAATLLFRAGEQFRRAFDEVSAADADGACRLAEVTAASAVGRRALPDDEARRLRDHAAYCRRCRETVATWGPGAIGLALLLEEAPLPDTLLAAPVFGTVSPIAPPEAAEHGKGAGGAVVASGSAAIIAILATIGRALTSKAAAYAVAAVCFAGFLGLVVYVSQHDWRPRIVIFGSGSPGSGSTRHVGPAAGGRSANEGSARAGSAAEGQTGEGSTLPGIGADAATDDRGVFPPALARLVVPVFDQADHVVLPAAPIATGGPGAAGSAGSPQGVTAPPGRGSGSGAGASKASRGGPKAGAGKPGGSGNGKGAAKSSARGRGKSRAMRGAAAATSQKRTSSRPARSSRHTGKPHAVKTTQAGKSKK